MNDSKISGDQEIQKALDAFSVETERLLLRKWTVDDAPDLFDFLRQKEVMAPLGLLPCEALDQAREMIKSFQIWYSTRYKYEFAVVFKGDNKAIGSISIKLKRLSSNIIEIGYLLNRDYWNQGIASEALGAVADFLRTAHTTARIICECQKNNIASKKVAEKSGFKAQGSVQRDGKSWEIFEL